MLRSLTVLALLLGVTNGSYIHMTVQGGGATTVNPCDECVIDQDSNQFSSYKNSCNGGTAPIRLDFYTDLACNTADTSYGPFEIEWGTVQGSDGTSYLYYYMDEPAVTFYNGAQWSSDADSCSEADDTTIATLQGTALFAADMCLSEGDIGDLTWYAYTVDAASGNLTKQEYTDENCDTTVGDPETVLDLNADCSYVAGEGYRSLIQTFTTSTSGSSALAPSIALAAVVALAMLGSEW